MLSFLFLVSVFFLGIFLAFYFSKRQTAITTEKKRAGRQLETTSLRTFTRDEVAKHNTADDVWVIIRPKGSQVSRVYDLTSYVDEHPGGDGILNHAGGDSTEGFYGPQHPPRAFEIIDDFCIGLLQE